MHSRSKQIITKPPRENWRAWTDEEIATIRRLAGTMPARAIGELLGGRSEHSVKHMARQYKISLRTHGERCSWAKYSDAQVEQARELHDQGVKPRQIAAQLGLPYWAVHSMVYYKRGLGYAVEH